MFTSFGKSLQFKTTRTTQYSCHLKAYCLPQSFFFIPKIIVVNDLFKLSLNSYAAKDTICVLFLDKKDPKLSLSELLSTMTRIQFNPTLFIWPSMWTRLEHALCLETINNMWFLGKRKSVNAWKKANFDGFREKEE